jgi:multicomponent Na+:H+ antiporter subunit B
MSEFEFLLVNYVLFLVLAVTGLAIARLRELMPVAMLSGLFSLTSASIFVLLDAVDVAFTEAAVGAGMTTVLMLAGLGLTRQREKVTPTRRTLPAALVVLATGALLIYATLDLPPYGQPDTPVQVHPLTERYLVESEREIGIPNVVTSVLASYRGYDTLGEAVVVFTAGIGVLLLLGRAGRRRKEP